MEETRMKLSDFLIGSYILCPAKPGDPFGEIKLEREPQVDEDFEPMPDKWVIVRDHFCLDYKGRWLYNRSLTPAQSLGCKFDSPDEGLLIWEQFLNKTLPSS
jgi:hypothetical protein